MTAEPEGLVGQLEVAASSPSTAANGDADERVRRVHWTRRVLARPGLGALFGAVIVWVVFAVAAGDRGFLTMRGTASYLEVAAQIGIIGVAASMLIIAGEFDLSVGSMVGASGMLMAVGISVWEWPAWAAVGLGFVFAVFVGAVQGFIVVRTGIPSFLVTLAGLFVLRGLSLAIPRTLVDTTSVGGIRDRVEGTIVNDLLATDIGEFPIVIVWWILLAVVGSWVLLHTRFGNWMFGVGGAVRVARNLGAPVNRVKIKLFMFSAFASALLAATQVFKVGSADANRGVLKELEAIITASIGGTLLMGGYGTVIGTIFGALTLGMTKQGLFFAAVNSEWYSVSLGVLLLCAVMVNQWIRKRAE